MNSIFISYKSEELEQAMRIRHAIMAATGSQVWWAQDLQTGGRWSQQIESALLTARCTVVLWSRRSVASPWVQQEAAIAKALGTLLPVRIDECKVPEPFADLQTAHLVEWNGSEKHEEFVKLAQAIKARTTTSPSSGPPSARSSSNPGPLLTRWAKSRGIGLIGADGTGKTTLVARLRQRCPELRYISEVSRNVIRKGYPLGKNAHPESYVVLMKDQISEVLNMVRNETHFISDRTLLDQLCYSRVNASLPRPAVTQNLIDLMEKVWFLEREYFELYFYFPIEFAIQPDGIREIDQAYQRDIDDEFQRAINNYNIPHIKLTGSLDHRVDAAYECIRRVLT